MSPRWFDEAQRAQVEALRRAAELETPLLVLGGGADPVADVGAERAFYDAVPGEKKLVIYEGFRHELFNETRRDEPSGEAVAWIAARAR